MQPPINPPRPWRIVAEELLREKNREKFTRLAYELDQSLGQQVIRGQPAANPDNEES